MGGRACIRGMRISVSVIISHIADGATFEEVLREFPVARARRRPTGSGLRRGADPGRNHRFIASGVRFLADMGVSATVVRELRTAGHNATHLEELGLRTLLILIFFAWRGSRAESSSLSIWILPIAAATDASFRASSSFVYASAVPHASWNAFRPCCCSPRRRSKKARWCRRRGPYSLPTAAACRSSLSA